jgi:hypothetical protein
MCDPFTIAGGTAAIFQLGQYFLGASSELNELIRILRKAPKEIQLLRQQISSFSANLMYFSELIKPWLDDLKDSEMKKSKEEDVKGIKAHCEEVRQEFEDFFQAFPLPDGKQSRVENWLERLRWYIRQGRVSGLRDSLWGVCTAVTFFMTLVSFDNHRASVKMNQAVTQEVKDLFDQKRWAYPSPI